MTHNAAVEYPTETQAACTLCGSPAVRLFAATIRERYEADYFRCPQCELLHVANPCWLQQAEDLAEAPADVGVLRRSRQLAQFSTALLRVAGLGGGRFVDYGGGYGVLTRLMRDAGFDFRCYDPFTPCLLARGFECPAAEPADGLTLVEVLEHLPAPRVVLDEVFHVFRPQIVIATTICYRLPVDPDWSYLSRETGQHVSFYSPQTMHWLAEWYGYRYSSFWSIHVFARRRIPAWVLRACALAAVTVPWLFRRRSLAAADFRTVRKLARPVEKRGEET